ncbi:discoidin domain-containing protein [Massilioclostridium coli]|uniref:galactose-binding domain-containing protein n=1 Tax=Massilioclostridium coli TaxID=1870991 RepID=UPI001356415E|nr:discoidin domain-containing protein [Massilioclostridium coli]
MSLLLAGCLCLQCTGMVSFAKSETSGNQLWSAFQTPPDSSKTRPLWFWNTELDEMTPEKVRELVRESYQQSGYNGFGILPNWISQYLSDNYFELYEAALDEGSKYGMHFSLYDENGFPSYNAGGLLEENYPELTTKRLDKFEQDASNGEKVYLSLPEGKLMGAVAMNMDTMERIDISDQATIVDPPPFSPDTQPLGVSASSTYSVTSGYEASKAVDGELSTRWNAESLSGGGEYLQINFGEEKTFDSVKVYEDKLEELHRTKDYSIQYWDIAENRWKTVATGTKITDQGATHSFEPVTAQLVRLYIRNITQDSASISEFQIFNGNQQLEVPPTPLVPEKAGYSASSVYEIEAGYEADKAFDGDMTTRWNAAARGTAPQWLEISFGEVRNVNKAVLYEDLDRITSFHLQYWNGDSWVDCATGSTIGSAGLTLNFDSVQTTKMRLLMDGLNGMSPTIWEMELYDGNTKIQINEDQQQPESSHLEYTVPDGSWKVMAFMCVKDGNNGMDYLDADSVRAFIDITYEEYYSRFQKYFENGTITSAFYDEPTFWPWPGTTPYGAEGARLWTPEYNKAYEETFNGESPVLNYPALWYDIGEDTDEARNKLQYVRTELFAENYIGQIADWCDDHGIDLMGHMLLEEWVNPVGLHGDLMKVFKDQQIPGVDVIGSYGYTQEAYKIISSSANNWDKGVVMSESFGAMGENMDKNILYKSSMDQYAKGVNMIIPHAIWYDNINHVDAPPELSYRNERYREELPIYNNYMGRLNTMLQDGRHVADIAMLYPIDYLESSFIFNGDANNPSDADYMRVGETLSLTARRDFTYLHPDIIDERCSVDGDTFHLENETNYEDYKVFVIPGTKVISLSNLEKIKDFYDNGGKVIATTQLPYRGIEDSENEQVISIIKEIFQVDPVTGQSLASSTGEYTKNTNAAGGTAYFIQTGFETKLQTVLDDALPTYDVEIDQVPAISGGNLSYIHKVKDNQDIYFIANSSDTAMNITVSLHGEMEQPMLWDPMTGTKQAATFTVENGITKVQLSLTGIQSMFIVDETQPVVEETDKSILQTVIQYAENAKTTDEYTNAIPSVKDSFDKALTDAKAINDNDSATQEQIDTAWRTLLNEIHKLGFQVGDKTKLQALYDEMSKVDLDDYKDAVSKENFVKALEQAATVLADPNTMQKEIDKAYDELETAYSLLEKAADKRQLKALIEATKEYQQEEYTENTWGIYAEAKAKAEEVYNNVDATQEEINEAADNLLAGMLQLRFKADKSLLEEVVEEAKGIDLSQYTVESAATFQVLLAEAQEMLNNNDLSKEDEGAINAKAMELKAAQSKLEPIRTAGSEATQTVQESATPKADAAKTGDVVSITGLGLLISGISLLILRKKK